MEKDYGPNKKATYSFEEVRPMIVNAAKDRAKYLGAFYKVMPRELFDLYAKKALWEFGKIKASLNLGDIHPGNYREFGMFLQNHTGVSSICSDRTVMVDCDDEKATVNMIGKCSLVLGWEEMGLSPEEVQYLCDIACYGDYGHADALGMDAKFEYTSADASGEHDRCCFVVKQKKEG